MNHSVRIHLLEIKYELLKALRMPAYSLPTLLFPIIFYCFFGLAYGSRTVGNVKMAAYMVATYGAFGVIGASLFGFGVGVAVERGQGWLEAKRTTPMPISAYFLAKIAMAMAFSTIIVLTLFAVSALGGVHMALAQRFALFAIFIAGSITFCAFGLAIAFFVGPNSAAPIVNLFYLPLAYCSGLWMPIWLLPKFVQSIALWLPPYHFSQLALTVIGADRGGRPWGHVAAMAFAAVLFSAIAYVGYRRDEGKLYG